MNMDNEVQILTGIQPVLEALHHRRRALYTVHISRKKDIRALLDAAKEIGLSVNRTSSDKITRLVGSSKHQGIALECGPIPVFGLEDIIRFEPPDGKDLLVLMTGVEDPRNLGAVVRCSSFLGARALIIPGKVTAPLSPTASKTSAGALESFPVAVVSRIANACQNLADSGYEVIGIESGGDEINRWNDPAAKTALVLGSEDKGIGSSIRGLCSRIISIPGHGTVGSLNLSVAAGIAMYHVVSHRDFK